MVGFASLVRFVVPPLLVAGCLAPQVAEPPHRVESKPTPAPWVLELDRDGLVIDGVRMKDTDREGVTRAIYDRWGREPILRVAPDVPSASVERVLMHARVAKLPLVRTEAGEFAREFWTSFLRDDFGREFLSFHVVGGDIVRFQRFGVPTDPRVPGTLERFDWAVPDERSGENLVAWLAKSSRPRDFAAVITPNDLPFGEAARVLTRLGALWKDGASMRMGFCPVSVALYAPIEQRFAVMSIPPPVVFSSMILVDAELERCYATSRDRETKERGVIIVKLTIDASGTVAAVPDKGTTIEDPKTLACMLSIINTVRFPKREGAPPVEAAQGFFYRSR